MSVVSVSAGFVVSPKAREMTHCSPKVQSEYILTRMSRTKNRFLLNSFRKAAPGTTVLCNRKENSNTDAQKAVDNDTNELSSLYALPILLTVQDVANFW